jgi:cytochrome c-type biogenesis protein CcmH
MTIFVLICVLMLLLALGVIAIPLLRAAPSANPEQKPRNRYAALVLTCVSVSVFSGAMYMHVSNWQWSASTAVAATPPNAAEIEALLDALKTSPDNLQTRLALAQAYVAAGNFALAGQSYQKAYDLSKGQNVDAVTGLLESLVLTDQSAMNGRAALLVEQALRLQENNPKALWYGGLIALQAENLQLARDRFSSLLAMGPPDSIRGVLERQVQDLDEQLNASAGVAAAAVVDSKRKITVAVRLSAAVKQQLTQPVSVFILARNPQQPGPPLAVERHTSDQLPLQVELTVADAMLPTRTLNDADIIEVVARLSASGAPTEQPGDWYGVATHSFVEQGDVGSLSIEITQRVP